MSSTVATSETTMQRNEAVCVVDTFSSGAYIADLLYQQGYHVIRVFSGAISDELLSMVLDGLTVQYYTTITYKHTTTDSDITALDDVITQLNDLNVPVIAVIAGAETGVELSDRLSERMSLVSNGSALSDARRDKYKMGEQIRSSGIRAVKQLQSCIYEEIKDWILEWNPAPFQVIVKPVNSAGSDDVTLCHSIEDVEKAYLTIIGKVNGLGIENKAVLVQEYLQGQEYVIDMVSRDGIHKCLAIWAYDRRAVNGGDFVCFGQRLLTADELHCQEMIEYQKKVLNALGILHGPTHGEVKWHHNEPVLVEVGARLHGCNGSWLQVVNEVYGYNQANCAIDAYLNIHKFNLYPDVPVRRNGYGRLLFLVLKVEGTLIENNQSYVTEIRQMTSHLHSEFDLTPGQLVCKTKNCYGFAGSVRLYNKDLDLLIKDYNRIREMEDNDLFIVE